MTIFYGWHGHRLFACKLQPYSLIHITAVHVFMCCRFALTVVATGDELSTLLSETGSTQL